MARKLKPIKKETFESTLQSEEEKQFYVENYHQKNEFFKINEGQHAFYILYSNSFEILAFKKL